MRFCCFNPMPWPSLRHRPEEWPFPNVHFDAAEGHDCFRRYIDQLVFAEACGFDWVGVGEDHMTAYSLTPNPQLVLAAVGARTSRVRLAILGCPLPLLNPLRVAEECAMLDVMSGGRAVVGFIRGVPQNYRAYAVDPDESRARFDEASALIVKAWTTRTPFSWQGRFYQYPVVSIWPTPLQVPHPPLVYSANSVTSAVLAARQRVAIGSIHLYRRDALELVRAAFAAYRQEAAASGWQPAPDRFLVGLPTCIAENDQQAYDLLAPALDYHFGVLSGTYDAEKRRIARTKPGYGESPVEENPPTLRERLEHEMVLCGGPATVIKQLRALRESLGAGVVSMQFQVGNLADDAVRVGMRLFGDAVRTAFAAAGAPEPG